MNLDFLIKEYLKKQAYHIGKYIDSIRHSQRLESFLLQRIIRQPASFYVIIFLYLKRRREGRYMQRPMVR